MAAADNQWKTRQKGKFRPLRLGARGRLLLLLLCVLCALAVVWYVRRPQDPYRLSSRPMPSDVTEAKRELFLRCEDQRPEQRARFRRVLRAISPELRSAPVTTGPGPLKWTTVTYNEQFGAVRFSSSLGVPADLRWCFVVEEKRDVPTWYILPAKGELRSGFATYQHETNLDLDVEGIPAKNLVFLQPLDGGLIQPGAEYILWFAFREAEEPVKMHMAIRLEPQGSFSKSTAIEDLAHDLGLSTPLKHTRVVPVDEMVKQIEFPLLHRDLAGALQSAERAGQLVPNDRQVLLWLGYLKVLRGSQLADNRGRSEGQSYFFVAAQHMRQLRDSFDPLSDIENIWLVETLYLEAESFALIGEKEKALASLREAFQHGLEASRIEAKHFEPAVDAKELHDLVNEFR